MSETIYFVMEMVGTVAFSISGAIFCIVCRKLFGEGIAMFGGTAVVVLLRLLAAHFRWKLPRA